MNANAKLSQQDEDTHRQKQLTETVGRKLTRPEKSSASPFSAVKRLLRIG
jgi:hypothetical protein